MSDQRIVPVVLSGGGGTRLWPMSQPDRPKQFLKLTGAQTMFQMTLERVRDTDKFAPPIIVGNAGHADLIEAQLAEIGVENASILLEPCARNTAPAIALAALESPYPDAPLLVMPSDHVITDVGAFHAATQALAPHIEAGWLATYGIAPTGPETGYGYIQYAAALGEGVNAVARFVEKPDAERAAVMIAGGDHVWNGGIFLFRADNYLEALASFAPEMLDAARRAMAAARREGLLVYPDEKAFAASPSDSIDYTVMEKSERVAVAPVSMGWSDVGSWDALYDFPVESQAGQVMEIDGSGCLVRSDGVRIHMAGVSDMIVVAAGNDVLIVPRGKSQDVKKIVEALKARS